MAVAALHDYLPHRLQFIGSSARTFPRLAISRGTILLQTGKMAALFDDAAWS